MRHKTDGAPPQETPRILDRRDVFTCPWIRLTEKQVDFGRGKPELYYSLSQRPYVAIVALDPESHEILVVRQYRPAVEAFTYELPAGLVDDGESVEDTVRRELLEETGHEAIELVHLGDCLPDTGRLGNIQHNYFARIGSPRSNFVPEPGITMERWTLPVLRRRILDGSFRHTLHVGALAVAALRGHLGTAFIPPG